MNQLFLRLLTRDALISADCGRRFLTELSRSPSFVPSTYGNTEPIKLRWNEAAPLEALPSWQPPFLWRRPKPRSGGAVWMADVPMHGCISLASGMHDRDGAAEAHAEATAALLRRWFSLFDGDFGFVHALAPADVPLGCAADVVTNLDRAGTRQTMTLSSHVLVKYLPEIYWAMAFGPSYVQHFTRARLLAAPAPVVHELDGGGVYLQLSENVEDLVDRPGEIERVRDRRTDNRCSVNLPVLTASPAWGEACHV